jgi:transcription antitermination factor NusG
VDPTLGACEALKRGLRVRITGGPFMGIEGVIENLKGSAKVLLNVEMINRAVPLEVDRSFLAPMD